MPRDTGFAQARHPITGVADPPLRPGPGHSGQLARHRAPRLDGVRRTIRARSRVLTSLFLETAGQGSATRAIVTHAVRAIWLLNHDRSPAAARPPGVRRGRIRHSRARRRRARCPVGYPAMHPASRRTRPAAPRPRRWCRSTVGSASADQRGDVCEQPVHQPRARRDSPTRIQIALTGPSASPDRAVNTFRRREECQYGSG